MVPGRAIDSIAMKWREATPFAWRHGTDRCRHCGSPGSGGGLQPAVTGSVQQRTWVVRCGKGLAPWKTMKVRSFDQIFSIATPKKIEQLMNYHYSRRSPCNFSVLSFGEVVVHSVIFHQTWADETRAGSLKLFATGVCGSWPKEENYAVQLGMNAGHLLQQFPATKPPEICI